MVMETITISMHVLVKLKAQIEETDSDFDKEKLQERLAKLAGALQ